jgi:hypothetical protein
VHHTTSQSLENSIKERIKRLLHSDVTDITPLEDLDAQLGTPLKVLDTEEPVDSETRGDVLDEESKDE